MNMGDVRFTRRTALGLGVGAAVTAVLASCGDDSGATESTSTSSPPTTAAAGTTVASTAPAATDAPTTVARAATRSVQTLHGAVEIPAHPQRIVCLRFVDTATLLDVGVTPVGMATWGVNFLPEHATTMADIPDVTVAGSADLNLELIASLRPDLIIGSDWLDPAKQAVPYDDLTAIAPTALCEWQQSAANWPDQAAFFADVVGKTPELQAVQAEYETSADAIRADHAVGLAAQTWALVQGGADGEWYFYTPESSHGQVFARAGVQFADIRSDEPGGYVVMSTENIGELAAASALALNMNVSAVAGGEALQAEPLFQALPAAQDAQVYPMTWFFPSSYKVASALLVELDEALAQLEAAG